MSILQDKVVLVTGAGGGIGRATALAMAEAGAMVAAADIDVAAAQRTAEQEAGNARRALAIEADCGDVKSIDAMVAHRRRARPARRHRQQCRGHPLRANHGPDRGGLGPHPPGQRQGRVLLSAARRPRDDPANQVDGSGGRIINIASISGRGYPGASNAAYAASKGAVISLTWMAAQQLGRDNINVNAICPGVTRTELGARNAVARAAERGVTVAELHAEQEANIPIRRANQPEDIAAMAVFLASPGARNITGQAYNVDGGLVPS